MRASLLKPRIFPCGIYAIVTFPENGTLRCNEWRYVHNYISKSKKNVFCNIYIYIHIYIYIKIVNSRINKNTYICTLYMCNHQYMEFLNDYQKHTDTCMWEFK
jgi:hypothetical protein